MDAASDIRTMAKAFLYKVTVWLAITCACTILAWSISDWAAHMHSWQARAVHILFLLLGLITSFALFFFCVLLWGWFAGYKSALRDAPIFMQDRERYLLLHKDVVGPIPWR